MTIVESVDTLLMEQNLSGSVTAYHCGKLLKTGKFRISSAGTGEAEVFNKNRRTPIGMGALGPAVYFSTNPEVAKVYCGYGGQFPYQYEVSIRSKGLVDETKGYGDPKLLEKLAKEREEVKDDLFFGGANTILTMFESHGMHETFKRLRKLGITGQYMTFDGRHGKYTEIAVYDPSIIRIKSATPMKIKAGSNRKRLKPDDVSAAFEDPIKPEDIKGVNWDYVLTGWADYIPHIRRVERFISGGRPPSERDMRKLFELTMSSGLFSYKIKELANQNIVGPDGAIALMKKGDAEEVWFKLKEVMQQISKDM